MVGVAKFKNIVLNFYSLCQLSKLLLEIIDLVTVTRASSVFKDEYQFLRLLHSRGRFHLLLPSFKLES